METNSIKYGYYTIITGNRLKSISWGENKVFVIFDNKEIIASKLIVGADGAKSWLRKKAHIPINFWEPEHIALVATIRTDIPHAQTIRQLFYNNSILTFLPLYDPCLSSIIWLLPGMQAYKHLALDESIFEKELSVALDMRLGFYHLVTKLYIYSLINQYACNFVAQRIVLIGEAAYTIHSFYDVEINFNLMDVAGLIEQLRHFSAIGRDIGQYFYICKSINAGVNIML